ncbi:beta-glucuronidase [Amblyomma americanum]
MRPESFLRASALIAALSSYCVAASVLYPRESESREVKRLDGVWNFRASSDSDPEEGFQKKWFQQPLSLTGPVIPMPVPSSFNDVTQNKALRDFVGWVWYDVEFFVPARWDQRHGTPAEGGRVFLRFGSVHYEARVYLNGDPVVAHVGGHLPFGAEVTGVLRYGRKNLLTVAVNNTLTEDTIPQGTLFRPNNTARYPSGYYRLDVPFDFFNYAGIHRSVILYTTPGDYIDDVLFLTTTATEDLASVDFTIDVVSGNETLSCQVTLLDDRGDVAATAAGCAGKLTVRGAKLWWPVGMHSEPGYLYTAKVEATAGDSTDVYYQKVGLRTVHVSSGGLHINGKPFYLMGFGKHEDSNIRGKGLDLALVVKDFNLIQWLGANSFRTSHYPYAEEIMDQADAQGIAVIDEAPAVVLSSFNEVMLEQHKERMRELVHRDKNRPSVILWSVANEPHSNQKPAGPYFAHLTDYVRRLDSTRPITAALNRKYYEDLAGDHLDVIMHNNYPAWYSDTGSTEVIALQILDEYKKMWTRYRKPIMISEYGAGAIAGLHADPAFVFTEDFQTEALGCYHRAFDELRGSGFFFGEHVWNFADFMTAQTVGRVYGNRKGILTRERQPKAAAKVIRCRYYKIANRTLPDADAYCIPNQRS